MADGKWIEGLRGDLAPDEAARRVLAARLRVVHDYLPRALHHSEEPENVHQLRVGTRRADAALRIFGACLPAKVFKAAGRKLRSLRRSAGEARDWDVFALLLVERRGDRADREAGGLDFLFGYAQGCRAVAQGHLSAAGDEAGCAFEEFVAETMVAVRPLESSGRRPTLADLARPMLAALRDELEQAASGDLENYAELHRVRIAGKRLRYAMEVFADCFGAPFKERLYPQVEEMQEILGRANDSHVAAGRLADVRDRLRKGWSGEWPRLRPGVEGLLRFHQRRLPQERRRFLAWWGQWKKEGEPLLRELLG